MPLLRICNSFIYKIHNFRNMLLTFFFKSWDKMVLVCLNVKMFVLLSHSIMSKHSFHLCTLMRDLRVKSNAQTWLYIWHKVVWLAVLSYLLVHFVLRAVSFSFQLHMEFYCTRQVSILTHQQSSTPSDQYQSFISVGIASEYICSIVFDPPLSGYPNHVHKYICWYPTYTNMTWPFHVYLHQYCSYNCQQCLL